MSDESTPSPSALSTQHSTLRVVDVDLHHQVRDWREVAPFVPEGLRWRVLRPNGPPLARHGYTRVGAPPALPATDPAYVKAEYLDRCGVDRAILTGSLPSLGVQPYPDLSAALARGINDWTLETWVRPFDCFKGSILVAQQDPTQAAAEIDRLGDDPGMVQVLMGSAAESPFGRRQYHPIYEACVRHNLPLALHIGGEGAGISAVPTGAGHPTTYFEWYGSLPQSYMGHIVSMISEGVFQKFPTLRVVLYEGGIGWIPHLMWRFDKNWKAQHGEVPWLVEPPSRFILNNFVSTTYPLEKLLDLQPILDMVYAERTLLFSGNYPNWEHGDPFAIIEELPAAIRGRVMVDNALSVYGERLLAPNR